MSLRMRVHDKEPIGLALRRFKKLIERSGMQKELRAHQHYEKPSELRRRARLRKEKAANKARVKTGMGGVSALAGNKIFEENSNPTAKRPWVFSFPSSAW